MFAEVTPKRLLDAIGIEGLKLHHIKSHLQVCLHYYIWLPFCSKLLLLDVRHFHFTTNNEYLVYHRSTERGMSQ